VATAPAAAAARASRPTHGMDECGRPGDGRLIISFRESLSSQATSATLGGPIHDTAPGGPPSPLGTSHSSLRTGRLRLLRPSAFTDTQAGRRDR
jgi:hypothetical protein